MPENPAPQNPEQPSPAPATPPESPQPPPPRADSKLDWRLVAVIALAVIFLIAIIVNKNMHSKPPAEPASPEESASKGQPSIPALPASPVERYAMMLRAHELEIQSEMFTEGGRTFLLAMQAVPAGMKENAKLPEKMSPGTLFDITKLAEGVRPEMLQRRMIYGPNQGLQAVFMDMLPPLGMDGHLEMVVRPAAGATAEVVSDAQTVVGVKVGAEARAYPIKLMNYHDVINDTLGGEPIAVVWNALAYAPSAMYRDQFTFGSAGLAFQGAIVMYSRDSTPTAGDKKVEQFSLWSPTLRLCIAGERAGTRLKPLQADLVSWQTWKTLNPQTTVFTATKPVLPINYTVTMAVPPDYLDPRNPNIPNPAYGFDVEKNPLSPKAHIFGITDSQGKEAKAYWAVSLREKPGPFEDTVGDRKLTLQFNPDTLIFTAKDSEGKPVLTEAMLWMAWLGAHPNSALWQEEKLRAMHAPQPASAPAGTSGATTGAVPQAPSAPGAPADTVR